MKPEEFIERYQNALAQQNWNAVAPLISKDVAVTFSNGTTHLGEKEVRQAFENNFAKIKSESYKIENVQWLRKERNYAVYIFEYFWSGVVNGTLMSGGGIGTSVIIEVSGVWKLLSEHLGSKSKKHS